MSPRPLGHPAADPLVAMETLVATAIATGANTIDPDPDALATQVRPHRRQHFCAIRSYLSTAAKHGGHFFHTLAMLAEGCPWTPAIKLA